MKKDSAPRGATNARSDHNKKNTPGLIHRRAELAMSEITAPSKRRLLRFLIENPGQRTDFISRETCIGYVPARVFELNQLLPRFGLQIRCEQPKSPLRNRYGDRTNVHCWRIVLCESGAIGG